MHTSPTYWSHHSSLYPWGSLLRKSSSCSSGSIVHLLHGCLVLTPVCVCSLNVNRFSPANYDQAHLHPHLFSDQSRGSPSSYSPSTGVGFPPTQALKVPPLDQFPTFPPSAHQHWRATGIWRAVLVRQRNLGLLLPLWPTRIPATPASPSRMTSTTAAAWPLPVCTSEWPF